MSPEEERELVADWVAGDIRAGNALVAEHERMIRRIGSRYTSPRCDIDDLIQVGRMALLTEARKYDATRSRLATWAYQEIRKAQSRYARKGRSVVSISEDPSARGVVPTVIWLDAPIVSDATDREAAPTISTFASPMVDVDAYIDAAMMLRPLDRRDRNIVVRHVCNDEEFISIGPTLGMSADAASHIKQRAFVAIREAAKGRAA